MKVAIMGYGTIGSGVAAVLEKNADIIEKKCGQPIELKWVLDVREFEGDPIQPKVVHDVNVLAEDPEVGVVVETMGGVEPAYTFASKMLAAGKSVVTSNKALVAKKGAELLEMAQANKVSFLFEASVGGAIPIIRPFDKCMTADEITAIYGIFNGTTNYMLTMMDRCGRDYAQVLSEAQEKGYAEKDPTADVCGYDTCRKIAIITSMVSGMQVDFEDIYTEGITEISEMDFKYAHELGTSVKLLGISRKSEGRYYAMVAPMMISTQSPLYAVSDVFNGILVEGSMFDRLMFYGRGAGSLPTATAVVADIIDAASNPGRTVQKGWSREKLELGDKGELTGRFFVRVSGSRADKECAVKDAFGDVSFVELDGADEFAFVTPVMTEAAYSEAAAGVCGIIHMIRMEA